MFTKVIEEYVRKYPEQWLWVHRRWKAEAGGEVVVLTGRVDPAYLLPGLSSIDASMLGSLCPALDR